MAEYNSASVQSIGPGGASITKLKKCLAEPRLSRITGSKGVTTFIKTILMRNVAFGFAPRVPTKSARPKTSRDAGLCIGRVTDVGFRDVVARTRVLSLKRKRDARLVSIFKLLRRLKITPFETQTPVYVRGLPIHTSVDGLGARGREVYVIELKCTQKTIEEHKATYKIPCRNLPKLLNGLENTEHNHHQLQAAFGAMALAETYSFPDWVVVTGLVVVSCVDGIAYYAVSPAMMQRSFFDYADVIAPEPAKKRKTKRPRSLGKPMKRRAAKKRPRTKPLPLAEFKLDDGLKRLLRAANINPDWVHRMSADEKIAVLRMTTPASRPEVAVAIVNHGAVVNSAKAIKRLGQALHPDDPKGKGAMFLVRPRSNGWKLQKLR